MLYDKERLDAAYAKVGLFADSAWAVNDADGYYKANQNLWKQTCALKESSEKLGKPRSVLDTIPESRLASYGNYLYDEEREKQYWNEYERPNYPVQYDKTPISPNNDNEEIWCNENVEKIFNILTNPYTKTSELEKRCLEVVNGPSSSLSDPTSSSSSSANPPGPGALAPRKEQLAIEYNVEVENIRNEPSRGTTKNFSELVLQTQLHSEEIRALWERNSQYSLNVNVPEFYPKQQPDNYGHQNQNINNNVTQEEPEHEHEHERECEREREQDEEVEREQKVELEQPVCEYETVLVPSLVPWLNYSYPLRSLDFREINYLANEFQNLIMNDRSATPCTSTSTSTSQTNFQHVGHQYEQATASPPAKQLPIAALTLAATNVASNQATSTATATATATAGTLNHQQQQQQQSSSSSSQPQLQPQSQSQTKVQPQATCTLVKNQNQQPTRRLYSAVLQNQTSDMNMNVAKSTSVDEFEELEREALEQYRPSSENLRRTSTDSIISAKYQELERLALEQYNSASSTDTSTGGQGNECNPPHELPCGGKMSPYAALLLANSVLIGFYRSVVNTRLLRNIYSNVSRHR